MSKDRPAYVCKEDLRRVRRKQDLSAQRLGEETSRQAAAHTRRQHPDVKSSHVSVRTQRHSRHGPSVEIRIESKWDCLVGAFASLSPRDRLSVAGGKLVVARREKRVDFNILAELELGLAADGSPLAVRRWRCRRGRRLDHTILSAMTPLLGLTHDNLLPYLLADRHDGEMFVAAPLCEANLERHVAKLWSSGTLESKARVIALQIMRGLQFLHSLSPPVVHGNLKPSNVLVDTTGVIKLADFGLGKVMRQLSYIADQSMVWWPPEYLAPAGQQRAPHVTAEGDVFSAGLLMHYVVTGGLHPFGSTRHEILLNVAGSNPCFDISEPDFVQVLAALFATQPSERPEVRDVLRHVFFWNKRKKWNFLLACAGISPPVNHTEKSMVHLCQFIDSTAAACNVTEDWVEVVKTTYPAAAGEPSTLSALLRFLGRCVDEQGQQPGPRWLLGRYFLAALPNLPLKLFTLLDNTFHAARPNLAGFFVGPDDERILH